MSKISFQFNSFEVGDPTFHFFFIARTFLMKWMPWKTWFNQSQKDPKCLNIHSHLDLKSLSFSTESTNVLLPTPWIFLTAAPRVRRSPQDTTSRCRDLTSARGKSVARNSLELTIIATGALVSSVPTKGSHSWNVSPDKSSTTRCNHNLNWHLHYPLKGNVSVH
jgi:hypothetical protein